jgi:anti-sigma factor RsiW
MNEEQQLRLQAYLDGELPEREARETAAWVESDPAAASLLAGLKAIRQVLAESEPAATLPESREFFWSKIARDIEAPDRAVSGNSGFRWQHLLWPVGAMALCLGVVMLQNPFARSPEPAIALIIPDADTPIVEAVQPGSDATTYRDETDGTTLVWFSMADNASPAKPTATF